MIIKAVPQGRINQNILAIRQQNPRPYNLCIAGLHGDTSHVSPYYFIRQSGGELKKNRTSLAESEGVTPSHQLTQAQEKGADLQFQ